MMKPVVCRRIMKKKNMGNKKPKTTKGSIGVLSDDLLLEVLLHTDLVSLLNFKRLSKDFHRLATEVFSRKHQLPTAIFFYGENHSLCYEDDCAFCTRDLKHSFVAVPGGKDEFQVTVDERLCFLPSSFILVDCCNGLLLCRSYGENDGYYVSNPVTKRWDEVILPDVNRGGSNRRLLSAVLAFDPRISFHYKVTVTWEEDGLTKHKIFDSEKGEWVDPSPLWEPYTSKRVLSPVSFKCGNSVFLAGGFYLLFRFTELLRFDLGDREVKRWRLPVNLKYIGREERCLGKSGNSINLAIMDKNRLRVWIFEEDSSKTSEWVLKHDSNIMEAITLQRPAFTFPFVVSPLGFHPHVDAVFLGIRGKIFCFDLKTSKLDDVSDGNRDSIDHHTFLPFSPFPFDSLKNSAA